MDKKTSEDVKKTINFFNQFDKGDQIPSDTKFSGLSLKNRPAYEMICDCCGSDSDCCGFN